MIISESTWVFTGLYDFEDDSFPAEYLTKGEIVTILEVNTSPYCKPAIMIDSKNNSDNFTHFVLVKDVLRCIITNKQLTDNFISLEEWRYSKITLILSD